jgi:hypothetical protein
MLLIRAEQLDALGRAPRAHFEDRLIKHCEEFYPDECRAIDPNELRRLAQSAIDVSTAQGYPLEREIAYFLSLMFTLGVDFYCDPQLPWNFDETGASRLVERVGAIDEFFADAMQYVDDIAGPKNEYLVRAMIRVRNFDLDTAPRLGPSFVDEVCSLLEAFYPEKFAYQGESVTRATIDVAINEAAQYGLANNEGLFCYAALMFMVGSGMHKDPVYGWISRTLHEPSPAAGITRGRRLFQAALEHISESLGAGHRTK